MNIIHFLLIMVIALGVHIIWDWIDFILFVNKVDEVSQEEWESLVVKAADDKVDLTFPQN